MVVGSLIKIAFENFIACDARDDMEMGKLSERCQRLPRHSNGTSPTIGGGRSSLVADFAGLPQILVNPGLPIARDVIHAPGDPQSKNHYFRFMQTHRTY